MAASHRSRVGVERGELWLSSAEYCFLMAICRSAVIKKLKHWRPISAKVPRTWPSITCGHDAWAARVPQEAHSQGSGASMGGGSFGHFGAPPRGHLAHGHVTYLALPPEADDLALVMDMTDDDRATTARVSITRATRLSITRVVNRQIHRQQRGRAAPLAPQRRHRRRGRGWFGRRTSRARRTTHAPWWDVGYAFPSLEVARVPHPVHALATMRTALHHSAVPLPVAETDLNAIADGVRRTDVPSVVLLLFAALLSRVEDALAFAARRPRC